MSKNQVPVPLCLFWRVTSCLLLGSSGNNQYNVAPVTKMLPPKKPKPSFSKKKNIPHFASTFFSATLACSLLTSAMTRFVNFASSNRSMSFALKSHILVTSKKYARMRDKRAISG